MEKGWWRVRDAACLRSIYEALHVRGLRERGLQRNLHRVIDSVTAQHFNGKSADGKQSSVVTSDTLSLTLA